MEVPEGRGVAVTVLVPVAVADGVLAPLAETLGEVPTLGVAVPLHVVDGSMLVLAVTLGVELAVAVTDGVGEADAAGNSTEPVCCSKVTP